jgi:hypothetical protein
MKNDLIDFFIKNSNELENIIEESKQVLIKKKSKSENAVILLNITYEQLKDGEEKLKEFINQLSNNLEENKVRSLSNFISEEKMNVVDFFITLENEKRESYPKLVDLDWKFVGLVTPNKLEMGEISPKILVRLFFNNGTQNIIETDLANFRKLHEELDQNLSSLNSTFTRKIDTFLK